MVEGELELPRHRGDLAANAMTVGNEEGVDEVARVQRRVNAGDTLLVCLSERLQRAVEPRGAAYRMGGDEFCVLFDGSHDDGNSLVHASLAALTEQGPGFSITSSHGVVRIPGEMSDPASILQLADQRLYRRKEEVAAQRSGDAHDGEDALPSRQHDRGPLARTSPEQGARDRRIRRQPPF